MILKTIFLSAVLFFNLNNTVYTVNANGNLLETNNNETTSTTYDNEHGNPIITINNADIGIFPGDIDTGQRSIITKGRLHAQIQKDFIVTGIKATDHGKEILIYATLGSITFVANHSDSSYNNRIAYSSSNMTVNQGQVAELTYNAYVGKWIITNIE